MNYQETGKAKEKHKAKRKGKNERERETTLTSICIAILYHNKYLLFSNWTCLFRREHGYIDSWRHDPLCIIPFL